MNELQIFNYQDKNLRVQKTETGEPLWCLADLCKMLGIKQTKNAKQRLDTKGVAKMPTLTLKGNQQLLFVNEPNLYRLIFQSEKQEARAVQDWVFNEVLPSIRKTGGYTLEQVKRIEAISTHRLEAVQRLNKKVKSLKSEVANKESYYKAQLAAAKRPVVTQRMIVQTIEDYSNRDKVNKKELWDKLYKELKYDYKFDAYDYDRSIYRTAINYCDHSGELDHLYTILEYWAIRERNRKWYEKKFGT